MHNDKLNRSEFNNKCILVFHLLHKQLVISYMEYHQFMGAIYTKIKHLSRVRMDMLVLR